MTRLGGLSPRAREPSDIGAGRGEGVVGWKVRRAVSHGRFACRRCDKMEMVLWARAKLSQNRPLGQNE